MQEAQAAAEARVTYIAEWQPAMIPGWVQTAAYARELFERLVSVIDLPTVTLGIVPFPLMPVMPLSSSFMHDEVVYIETLTGEQRLAEPDEVAVYVRAFELLRAAAVTGPAAVALIQRVAAELRDRSATSRH